VTNRGETGVYRLFAARSGRETTDSSRVNAQSILHRVSAYVSCNNRRQARPPKAAAHIKGLGDDYGTLAANLALADDGRRKEGDLRVVARHRVRVVRLLSGRFARGLHQQELLLGVNPTAAFIFTLLGFAAGFAVRPFGAIVFGRLGDLVGRKHTFLVTIVIMGSRPSWSASCPATSIGIARR
jgi:hypothetical protein